MKKLISIPLASLIILLVACEKSSPPAPYQYERNPVFTWGFVDFYGNYYHNYDIENNVSALNLFTEKLVLNEDQELIGTGQYLIIEDVFSTPADTLLPAGEYRIAETGEPFTFYSGKKFEDNRSVIPSGAYIYFIEPDDTKIKVALITGGTFTVSIENGTIYNIQCNFVLDGNTELTGTFRQTLDHFNLSATTQAGAKREFLIKKEDLR